MIKALFIFNVIYLMVFIPILWLWNQKRERIIGFFNRVLTAGMGGYMKWLLTRTVLITLSAVAALYIVIVFISLLIGE